MAFKTKTLFSLIAPLLLLILAGSLTGCASNKNGKYQGMSPEAAFVSAAMYGELDTVIQLHKEGVDIDTIVIGSIIRPALTLASYMGHMDVVQYLVENGADMNMTSGEGEETALIMAVKLGEDDIARYLIDSGADTNIKDADGKSALYYAMQDQRWELCQYLHDHGAELPR